MSDPEIAGESPIGIQVEAGKTYVWCACGLSNNQPFCDGSHQKTDLKPIPFKAKKTETVYFCNCKQSKQAPICDGSHHMLNL